MPPWLAMLNDIDRFRLAPEVLSRVDPEEKAYPALIADLLERRQCDIAITRR